MRRGQVGGISTRWSRLGRDVYLRETIRVGSVRCKWWLRCVNDAYSRELGLRRRVR